MSHSGVGLGLHAAIFEPTMPKPPAVPPLPAAKIRDLAQTVKKVAKKKSQPVFLKILMTRLVFRIFQKYLVVNCGLKLKRTVMILQQKKYRNLYPSVVQIFELVWNKH